ncbi:hypothetical protein WR25_27184 [Diploscapter pachys]|uniref:Ras-associating domain-containing protein n=1 Tax=Diploscapter pachys TaxID=2018661 RepID=A0A2A2L0H9_9BILA|nr:hypothetical protein WR25_27184 [Diploscapter pachys]
MWHRDDREGRFLLRRDRMPVIPLTADQLKEAENMKRGQKRYSKRDKNDKKKKHKDVVTVNNGREEAGVPPGLVSTDIYKQLPSNTFTRTISNPEVVMKKRRERKLESKLKEIKQGEGGSLKIYGGEVVPSRPYVTILASINDSGERILNEALEKYGLLDNRDDYVLVEMPCSSEYDEIKNSQGRIVAPDENPLMTIATRVQKNENAVDTYLSIQRKPADYRVPTTSAPEASIRSANSYTPEPSLVVLDEEGRTQIPQHHVQIRTGVTEVGSDRALSQFSPQNIYLDGPDIRGRHCVVTFMDGVVTITPSATDAYIEVIQLKLTKMHKPMHTYNVIQVD